MAAALPCAAETVQADTLQTATVTAERGLSVSHKDTVTVSGGTDITEALLNFPGLQVTDMGGQAGLKTVSLRGLGTAHTAIYIDGVKATNLQNGQNDLGMIDMRNCSAIVIDYAQNSINFITARPVFGTSKNGTSRKIAGMASVSAASFGTWSPSVRLDWKASEKVSLGANVSWLTSKGNFPFHATDEDGNSVTLRRTGNDISRINAGMDARGVTGKGEWTAKAYCNSSDRGTPGPVSYPSEDRQKDLDLFLQGTLRHRISGLYAVDLSAKVAYDDLRYTSSWGDSRYIQHEAQLHSSHYFSISDMWKVSVAAGAQWDGLASESYGKAPGSGLISRIGAIGSVAASFSSRIVKAKAALEYYGAFDPEKTRHSLSPSADIRILVTKGLEVTAFARRAYRIPTFNELYYAGFGNPELEPEDAWLSDIGIVWNRRYGKWKFKTQAEGFCNFLKNKITSAPTPEDPAIWLPYNIGKVLAAGLDACAKADWDSGPWKAGAEVRYSFQDAKDKTPGSLSYGSQIPYISRHSMTATAKAGYMGWTLGLVWNMRSGRNDSTGPLDDWNTLDASLSKTFILRRKSMRTGTEGPALKASLTAKNLTGTAYELSRGYPMPGTSVLGSLSFMF